MFSAFFSFSYANSPNLEECANQNIFFLKSINLNEAELVNFYCDYGKNIDYEVKKNFSLNVWNFVIYNKNTKELRNANIPDIKLFILDLKLTLNKFKKDSTLKENLISSYINDYKNYDNELFKFFEKYIFNENELKDIDKRLQNTPLKIFENTYSQRLLMNWRIISREEWWANEEYSKKEIYMKWCEDWSCYTGPSAPNQLKDNYMKYFNDIDAKNRLVKTFDDWRDTLRYYPVDRIIIHHTAWWYKSTKEEGMAYMRAAQKYHALTLRWGDIWYHYLIDGEWNIYEWHAGWKYVLWAHVSTHNYWTVWISLMSDGYYSEAMLDSLKDLVIYLWDEYDLDLTWKTTVRKDDLTWWTDDWWALLAHKELDSRKPYDPDIDMDEFREEIADKIKFRNYVLKYKK